MQTFIDQTGRSVHVGAEPVRIVSIVPSQTELLFDLGLGDRVIGITKFCVHPTQWFETKKRVGGTKQLHIDQILSMQPDLIIANKEENVREQVEQLANEVPVWISDVHDLASACTMIEDLGRLTGMTNAAMQLCNAIAVAFANLRKPSIPLRAVYLIWRDPYMTVGGDTFISDMMSRSGLVNVFASESRYPTITLDQLRDTGPDLLLLSSEPYPFKRQHADELSVSLPQSQILLVDGEYFSWYGSRMLEAPGYFHQLHRRIQTNL